MLFRFFFFFLVGGVSYVIIYKDQLGEFSGHGTVVFNNAKSAQKAVSMMNGFLINGNRLIVKVVYLIVFKHYIYIINFIF